MEQKDEKMINETGGRTLTKAESIRLKQFALTATEFEQQGYKQENVTISAGKANTIGILIGGAVSLPFAIAFHFMVGYNNHETVPLYLILCPVALIGFVVGNSMVVLESRFVPVTFSETAFSKELYETLTYDTPLKS